MDKESNADTEVNSEIGYKIGLLAKNNEGKIDDKISLENMEQSWTLLWGLLTSISASSSSETRLDSDDIQTGLDDEDIQQIQELNLSDDESPSESSDRGGIQIRRPSSALNTKTSLNVKQQKESPSTKKKRFKKKSSVTKSGTETVKMKKKKRRLRRFRKRPVELVAEFKSDVVGVMFLEIVNAKDLPPERNVTHTGFDMDPFVIVTFGSSTFRTRSVRHNLNPVWNEKLFFHVRNNESKYKLKLAVYDKDKFSGNDLVGWQEIPIIDIIDQSNQQRQHDHEDHKIVTSDSIDTTMDFDTIPLNMVNDIKWKDRHQPTLTLRTKFVPYTEIRKMFWLSLAKNYDVNGDGTMSKLEVQAMLESLGSTITEATLNNFWMQHGKDPHNERDEISMEDLAQSLEDFVLSSEINDNEEDEEDLVNNNSSSTPSPGELLTLPTDGSSTLNNSNNNNNNNNNNNINNDSQLSNNDDFNNSQMLSTDMEDDTESSDDLLFADALEYSYSDVDDEDEDEDEDDEDDDEEIDMYEVDEDIGPLNEAKGVQYVGNGSPKSQFSRTLSTNTINELAQSSNSNNNNNININNANNINNDNENNNTSLLSSSPTHQLIQGQKQHVDHQIYQQQQQQHEKAIRLTECPICHRPNLSRRGQMDILTHVAICSANDWTKVDRFLMGNFVTEQYAQRKWFVKLVSKVGYGKYSPGENNANIIVHDRRTGQLIEERMSVYIRLGMRLLYKGMKTGIQSKTAKRILTNLTIRQGRKYDSPQSVREIPAFIKFHQLDLSEVLDPLDSFKTFNEFFYRKLKPEARPCEEPDNPSVIVSPADCRMMSFQTIDQATKIWIKGVDFSLAKLFDDVAYSLCFEGGSLAIFRLAPQDYHRFHIPVDGIITETKHIEGQYYTVNPMAIRTTLDVYGDNARSIVRMETEEFGKVAIVCIGAMMVGSIIITAEVGKPLKRADELGYFAFGGSTLVVTWEKGAMRFDDDLLENGHKSLETLVRVGERIAIGC
ncbi:unnamed protein product [Cunninghamella blakesleeana]